MKNLVSQSCVVVLALDRCLAHYLSLLLSSDACVVVVPRSEQELYRVLLATRVDLVIVVALRHISLDDMLYRWVEVLLAASVDIFVVMHHHSVHHTLRLLSCGVRQCMTLSISPHRLRSKVYDHLATNILGIGTIS